MKSESLQSDMVKRHENSCRVRWRAFASSGWRNFALKGRAHWLRQVQRIFFTVGLLCLGYCGAVLTEAAIVQTHARGVLNNLRAQRTETFAPFNVVPPAQGAVLGSLDSPRIGLSVMVLEGTDKRTLRLGAGHLAGSALPGQSGNVVIAGHRDTFFRPLRGIKVGDEINLTSPDGEYRYQIIWSRVVPPNETQALEPTPDANITLVTCYPFAFVGPAPNRLVIRAARVETPAP